MQTTMWTRALVAAAGFLGFAGVATGAAGTHAGGGDLARLASFFLLIHSAAICGIVGLSEVLGVRLIYLLAASALAVGVVMFSADLAVLAFAGASPLRILAPVGGLLMLSGWALLAVAPLLRRGHN